MSTHFMDPNTFHYFKRESRNFTECIRYIRNICFYMNNHFIIVVIYTGNEFYNNLEREREEILSVILPY